MKVGDLVKLLDLPEVQRNNREIPNESVGIIVKVDSPRPPGFLRGAWVQWLGLRVDVGGDPLATGQVRQRAMWLKELEVISESG